MANQRVAHVRQHRSSLMLSLRTLLILVLGISVVAAIPVSQMTSSIHRRDPGLGEALKDKIKYIMTPALDMPADQAEAGKRLNGLWAAVKKLPPSNWPEGIPHHHPRGYNINAKIADGKLVMIWPRWHGLNTLLNAPTGVWKRVDEDGIDLLKVSSPSQSHTCDAHFVEGHLQPSHVVRKCRKYGASVS